MTETRYSGKQLEAMPTLSVSQWDDLKLMDLEASPHRRVWLSRALKADGAPYPNQIIEEEWSDRTDTWVTRRKYRG